MASNKKFELKVFEEKTTHKNDYRPPKMVKPERHHEWTRYNVKPEKTIRRKPYAPKDIHTMRPWSDPKCRVPFDLLWETKPIIRTHPQQMYGDTPKIEDLDKEEIIKTRPRRYMTPAVSMDDIADKEVRDLLCKNMYMTAWQKASEDVPHTFTEREVPKTVFTRLMDPLKADYDLFKPLPEGWKDVGIKWEPKQYTTLIDPDRAYWKNYTNKLNTPVGIDPYQEAITDDARKEIRELVAKDELRMAYDLMKPDYTGFRPTYPVVGPLKKQELLAKDQVRIQAIDSIKQDGKPVKKGTILCVSK